MDAASSPRVFSTGTAFPKATGPSLLHGRGILAARLLHGHSVPESDGAVAST